MSTLWMGNFVGIPELEIVKGVQLNVMQMFPGYVNKTI